MKRSFCKLLILSNFLVFMTGHALFSSNIDSLKALTEAASPEKKVKLFIQLSEEYYSDSLSLSMEYAREALNIAEQINDRKAESDALCQIGNVYYYLYKPEKALEIFSECLDIKQKINDEKGLSKVLNYIGVVYYDMPNYDSAKKYFTHSYDIAKES
ncbi:MAG: tetratricopeptide repeat protein, partial [Bacteroidota bacterium]